MTLSEFRRITDELLSAYIDDEVTEQERALVEAAIAQDQEIAWRLDSLRQTVNLLRDLPELPLPRSFTLTFDQVQLAHTPEIVSQPMGELSQAAAGAATSVSERAMAPRTQPKTIPVPQPEPGFWDQVTEGWRGFWQGGNPILRNAAAVSFALMLLVTSGGQVLNRAMQPAGMMATTSDIGASKSAASMSAPVAPAPAAESVAILPAATAPASVQTEASEDQGGEEGVIAGKVPETALETATETDGARIMEAPAESAAANAVPEEAEQAPASQSDAAVQSGEAAVAAAASESAPAQDTGDATGDEPAAAAAMMAPAEPQASPSEEMPPLVAIPFPGGDTGIGSGAGGRGGGADEGAGGAPPDDLVPEQAYVFDVDPLAQPTPVPAEEAVSASVAIAAAPAEDVAEDVADVVATPAVDAPAARSAVITEESANEEVVTEEAEQEAVTENAVADEAAAGDETSADTVAPDSGDAEMEALETEVVEAEPTVSTAPTVAPTAEAVALVAPEAITSSDVIANVREEDVVTATSYGVNLPVVWIAQGGTLLLTVLMASLWWRSRTPRRPRGS